MEELTSLTAAAVAALLRARTVSAEAVLGACLDRISRRDVQLHAWIAIDADAAHRRARSLDDGPIRGPLHGVPIAVKDIIDTAALPTAYGSPIYAGHRPAADAACVAAALAAGAVVVGKTATTEFACQWPAATVNPLNPAHSPGGSSSGSAAAVADCMVPLGFGTQTAGSVIRPASYCGIVGYKPTFGTIARAGVKLVAESLDTVGVLARSVGDAALFAGAVAGRDDLVALADLAAPPRLGFCRTFDWAEVDAAVATALESVVYGLAAHGAHVADVSLPARFAGLGAAHATIQGYEAVRNLATEYREQRALLSAPLTQMLAAGSTVTSAEFASSRARVDECRASLEDAFAGFDVVLAASATGEAPAGLASTGSPVMNRIWTALHVPCVSVPAVLGPHRLPVGLQIIGRVGDDARTLAVASWIEQRLGTAFADDWRAR